MSISDFLFGPKVPAVTVDELHALIQSGGKFYLLDVRTAPEFNTAHVEVTHALVPYDILDQHAARMPVDKSLPIFCICRSGRRSAYSTQYLRSVGHEQVYNVTGGILAWAKAGYAVTSGMEPDGKPARPKDFFSLA
jgi:rhodanese-related sulfurtransferase